MEFKEMNVDELNTRKAEIAGLLDSEDADLDALEAEVRSINEELETRASEEAKKVEIRKAVAEGTTETVVVEEAPKTIVEERKTMENIELRNTPEYIDQFAEYIKTEKRGALLTENVSGGVAVPELVYEIVKHAWEKEGIMRRVRKAYMKGNLKVGFEISSTGAVVHTEGTDAPSQETLVLGTVELVPKSIKKWITISDEVYDLRGEAFLNYVYQELSYQIAKKAADELIAKIIACGTVSTTTSCAVPAFTAATIALGTIAKAIGQLSDEASDPCIMMNKATWAEFKAVQYAGNFGIDIFEGLDVEFNSSITAFSAATTGVCYCIVGDLDQGALANFPNGNDISFKFDDKSLAESDLVKIVGREYIGLDVVAPKAFVKITK